MTHGTTTKTEEEEICVPSLFFYFLFCLFFVSLRQSVTSESHLLLRALLGEGVAVVGHVYEIQK